MANKKIDEPTGVETVGHEWDGIEELNNPLPRWWVISTYLTIIFAIGYMVVYPAIPLLNKGTEGVWGWSSRAQLAAEMEAGAAGRKAATDAIAAVSLEALVKDEKLMPLAIQFPFLVSKLLHPALVAFEHLVVRGSQRRMVESRIFRDV